MIFRLLANHIKLYYKSCLLISLLFYYSSFSQFNKEILKSEIKQNNPILLQAIPFITNDSTSLRLIVIYRINPSILFFTKSDNLNRETYFAKGDFIIEITNEEDFVVARKLKPILLEKNYLPTENEIRHEELQGIFNFNLKTANYKIIAEFKDFSSNQSFFNKGTKVIYPSDTSNKLKVSPLFFIEPFTSTDTNSFTPLNRGGDILIGSKSICMFQIYTYDTTSELKLNWNIVHKNEFDGKETIIKQGEQFSIQYGSLYADENQKQARLSITRDNVFSKFILISIPSEQLETGFYKIKIYITQTLLKFEREESFNIIWPSKPKSLSNFKIAVEALKYIATEEEIKQMNLFSSEKSKKAFQEFWKKRNKDTLSAYNPAMAEYYRRVDEAIKRFSTENESDGYLTDRGRIYILFGSPTMTNRLLRPNSTPTEIWTYEKLKRRFTFTDRNKTGNYILIKTENY